MSKGNATGVVAAVQQDHREIEKMLADVESSSGDQRRAAFAQLATKLKAHETAEEKVVHSLAEEEGNAKTVAGLENEESEASRALEKLSGLDPDSDEFETGFAKLKRDVVAHAKEEERDEHPRIMEDTSPDELERRAEEFKKAEAEASRE